jgi:tetratricopeptide (TPR) repeat protein
MVLHAHQRHDLAARCYERSRRLEPANFRWAYYLGWARAELGEQEDAVAAFREALRLNPEYDPTALRLAESLRAAGRVEESGEVLEGVVARNPDSATAHFGLARFLASRGDDQAALAAYLRACEIFPPYGAAHYALAQFYRKLGREGEARQHVALYEKNRNLVPPERDPLRDEVRELVSEAVPHLRRGIALEEVGRLEEAVEAHLKALEIDPELVYGHANLIILYARLGQKQKAEEHYRQAVRLNPYYADSHYNYGVMLLEDGRNAEAEQAFKKAIEANPYHVDAHYNLGHLLETQGKLDEALEHFRQAVARRPDHRAAHFRIGRILVHRGELQEAIRHLQQTLTPQDSQTPTYLYALASAYARARDRDRAIEYAHKAREMAAAYGQTKLLAAIERDLKLLETGESKP